MTIGKVVGIYIANSRGDPTVNIDEAHVIPGMGIVGDRYFTDHKKNDADSKGGREITLIELETIEAIIVNDDIQLTPSQTRRNIITHGIALNDLVGRRFVIGDIQLKGIRLCEPCNYLASRTDPRILKSLLHRGGLRAEIITEGIIYLNDKITLSD